MSWSGRARWAPFPEGSTITGPPGHVPEQPDELVTAEEVEKDEKPPWALAVAEDRAHGG